MHYSKNAYTVKPATKWVEIFETKYFSIGKCSFIDINILNVNEIFHGKMMTSATFFNWDSKMKSFCFKLMFFGEGEE